MHIGVLLTKRQQAGGNGFDKRRGSGKADGNLAEFPAMYPSCPVRRLIDLGDDLPRLFQKLSSGRRQPDVAVIALQKQHPHLLLQDLDLLA